MSPPYSCMYIQPNNILPILLTGYTYEQVIRLSMSGFKCLLVLMHMFMCKRVVLVKSSESAKVAKANVQKDF